MTKTDLATRVGEARAHEAREALARIRADLQPEGAVERDIVAHFLFAELIEIAAELATEAAARLGETMTRAEFMWRVEIMCDDLEFPGDVSRHAA